MALPDDRESRPTTADDLRKLFDCWTRLEVLIALSGRPSPVGVVAAALTISKSLFQAHTRTLRAQRLLLAVREGKQVLLSLAPHLRLEFKRNALTIRAAADDGARLSLTIPAGSPAMRMLAAGLWARDHDEPNRFTAFVARRMNSLPAAA